MDQNVPNIPPDYYTAPYREEKLDKFLGSDNKQSFFTRSQRSRIIFEILSAIVFGREKKGEKEVAFGTLGQWPNPSYSEQITVFIEEERGLGGLGRPGES